MKAGQILWIDEVVEKVGNAIIINLVKETVIESDSDQACRVGGRAAKMRFNVSVPDGRTDENARQLKRWFWNEWDEYERKRGDTRMVDTKTLYRGPKNNTAGNAKESGTVSEAEESEFNRWSLSSHLLCFGTP